MFFAPDGVVVVVALNVLRGPQPICHYSLKRGGRERRSEGRQRHSVSLSLCACLARIACQLPSVPTASSPSRVRSSIPRPIVSQNLKNSIMQQNLPSDVPTFQLAECCCFALSLLSARGSRILASASCLRSFQDFLSSWRLQSRQGGGSKKILTCNLVLVLAKAVCPAVPTRPTFHC